MNTITLILQLLITTTSYTTAMQNMQTPQLTNPTVRAAIQALADGNATTWFNLFTKDAELYDDGHRMNFHEFFNKAIGHERFTSIDKVEQNGLHVYGHFHSDQWGNFKTYFKFHINAEGRIDRLDIGQASY